MKKLTREGVVRIIAAWVVVIGTPFALRAAGSTSNAQLGDLGYRPRPETAFMDQAVGNGTHSLGPAMPDSGTPVSERTNVQASGRTVTDAYGFDSNGDGTDEVTGTFSRTYDIQGRLVLYTGKTSDAPAAFREEFSYDNRGQVLRHLVGTDQDEDGHVDFGDLTEATYGQYGVLQWRYQTTVAGGAVNWRQSYGATYDAHGHLSQDVSTLDIDGDGPHAAESVTRQYAFDVHGRLMESTLAADLNGDGSIDQRQSVSSTWDPRTNTEVTVLHHDAGADGTIDFSSQTTLVSDQLDRIVKLIREDDNDGDGNYEVWHRETSEYSAYDSVRRVFEDDRPADGVIDRRVVAAVTYDQRGNVLAGLSEYDGDADGTIDSRTSETGTYDGKGRVLSHAYREEQPGRITETRTSVSYDDNSTRSNARIITEDLVNDVVMNRGVDQQDLDARGNVIRQISEADDYPVDGQVDRRSITRRAYDSAGRLVSEIDESDVPADGTIDQRSTFSLSYGGSGKPPNSELP